jgi:hypothetical protein
MDLNGANQEVFTVTTKMPMPDNSSLASSSSFPLVFPFSLWNTPLISVYLVLIVILFPG